MKAKKEIRLLPARELRAAKNADGKSTLGGYAAVFNSLSDDLGGWREKIAPDAFTRTLKDQPDVYCLYAHGSQVLGRTKAGTLTLNTDAHGLHFDNTLPDTTAARDLITSIERGDVDGCSFGFFVRDDSWEEDGTGMVVRTLNDVELGEISVTPMPAYPATSVSLRSAPLEIRNKITLQRASAKVKRDAADGDPDPNACLCACSECMDGDCEDCSNQMCTDPNCRCMMSRSKRLSEKKTKRVDGEDLPASSFLIVLDPDKTDTWNLPWKFSTDEKTKSHLRDALARFDQLEDVPKSIKDAAHDRLIKLCKEYKIEVSDDDERSVKPTVTDGPGSSECQRGDAPACQCGCAQCRSGSCEICSNADCDDPECRCMNARTIKNRMQMRIRLAKARRK